MRAILIPIVFIVSIALVSCDDDPTSTDPEITEVRMVPEEAQIAVGEQQDFSFELLTESGEVVDDANVEVDWWSTDTTVFTVDESGFAVAQDSGEAYCMVEVTELAKAALFTGRDSAFVRVSLF